MTPNDRQLDERLRRTPAPSSDLFERLHGIPADAEIAESLASATPAPAGLLDRLHLVVSECGMDERLKTVPRIEAVTGRLHGIPLEDAAKHRRRTGWLVGVAAAMTALAAQWFAFAAAFSVARPEPTPEVLVLLDVGPLELTAEPDPPPLVVDPTFTVSVDEPSDLAGPQIDPPWRRADPRPWSEVAALIESGVDLSADMVLAKWGVLGAANDPEATTPELEEVRLESPRGVEPPRLRGVYDRGFLLREQENPPLSPAAHPELAVSRPPLSMSTESVDALRRSVRKGRLLAEDELRVEDFLAAQRYPTQAGPGQIQLTAAAGPSRFAAPQVGLLQLLVDVGRLPGERPPTHWTLAVDVSSGMAWRNRMLEVRRTLARLVREMRPVDRISLIAFREEAWVAAHLVTEEQSDQVLQAIEQWEPRGRCDFAAGMRLGLSTAVDGGFQGHKRLIVISDGRASWPENVQRQILGIQNQAKRLDVQLQWLELAGSIDASDQMVRGLQAEGVAAAQVPAGEAAWQVIEAAYGRSLLAAVDAHLTVEFEPKSVRFHRLIGHQANPWAGVQPQRLRVDLRRGDQANVLYEIWLHPTGPSRVATATLKWRDPRNGQRRERRQRITRADFAMSFVDSPASLQLATLAAEAGEVLSRSFFAVNRSRTLQDVIAACDDVKPQLQQDRDFQRFRRWLREVELVRQRRGD